jgi:hypothetical protein
MKQIFPDKIINVDSNISDNKFLIKKLKWENNITLKSIVTVIFLSDLLEEKKNLEMLEKSKTKPATYWNVYSPEDEFDFFKALFEDAIKNNTKIHIVWITLDKEVQLLEQYYEKLWFFSEDINAFKVDFSKALVSASVKIENLMWRWSDYKKMGSKIFFNPPIRESGQVKAMFKWINRGVTAWIYIENFDNESKTFLNEQIKTEHILPVTMAKTLNYNLADIWFKSEESDFVLEY